MRLHEVERGDTFVHRFLISSISFVLGMSLPDAARAVLYHKTFFGGPMSAWTHAAMRGESEWSVGERELIATLTAEWNACPFCIGAHGAIAARVLGRPLVDASLADLSPKLRTVLPFLEKLTKNPDQLTTEDAKAVLQNGVSAQAFEDTIAVCVNFNITTRCADTLGYQLLDQQAFDKSAKYLLERGYAFGQGKRPKHPDHQLMIERVRTAVLAGPGITDLALRQAMAKRAAGSQTINEPYDSLAKQISEAAYKVTDGQVKTLVQAAGSEKAAYELLIAAIVGAGFSRWDKAQALYIKAITN